MIIKEYVRRKNMRKIQKRMTIHFEINKFIK